MIWDIVSTVFVAVTANHLGLIGKIGEITGRDIPVLSCPKCLSFWATLGYQVCHDTAKCFTAHGIVTVLAISFLASYAAIWLELTEGLIDTLYLKLYGKITQPDTDNTAASDAEDGDTAGSVSELQQDCKNTN